MRQKEIVEDLAYPQSSTAFLLKSLIKTGYLAYNRKTRLYMPTPEVIKLGKWMEHGEYDFFFGRGIFTRLLEELRSRTNETVAVSMQNDIYVHWHRLLESELSPELFLPEGKLYPLTYSSHGWMLLSALPDEQVDKLVRLINMREPEHRTDLTEALDLSQTVREQGYCFFPNRFFLGAGSVATLLPWRLNGRSVTIGVGGRLEEIETRTPDILAVTAEVVSKYRDEIERTFDLERRTSTMSISADHQS